MRMTIESTSRVVTVVVDGAEVPARVWEGYTHGTDIPVLVLVTRIAVKLDADQRQFEADLERIHRPPSPDASEAFPMRMIL